MYVDGETVMDDAIHNLFEAIEAEHVEQVREFLANTQVDINHCPKSRGMTALHLAVGINSSEIAQLLLQHNADPNSRSCIEGVTPLHLSVLNGCDSIVKMLVKAGGNPHLEDEENKTCFDIAKNEHTYLLEELTIDECKGNKSAITSDVNRSLGSDSTTSERSSSNKYYPCLSVVTEKTEELSSDSFVVRKVPAQQVSNNSMESLSSSGINNLNTFEFITEDDSISIGTPLTPPTSVNTSQISNSCGEENGRIFCNNTSSSSPNGSFAPLEFVCTEEELMSVRHAAAAHGLPVLPSTVKVLSKFVDSRTQSITLSPRKASSTHGYSMELDLGLRNMALINQWREYQVEFIQTSKSGKNTGKSFFNYLLLDPYIIKRTNFSGNNLKTALISNPEKFDNFLKAIFYIGKGSGTRPLQHLVDAKQRFVTKQKHRLPDNSKLDKVLSIWEQGQGVILLSLFHHSPESETNANEAAMIDSVGLSCAHLTNVKKGSYVNTPAVNWSQKKKNQFGAFLLYRAFCLFVVTDCKEFHPNDV